MAGDDDRARGWVAAWDLRDDVARRLLADQPGGVEQFHPQRAGRALALANELVGVGVGDRPGGNRGHAVREIGHARVRIAVIFGADRADDDADRALLRGDVRSHEPTSAVKAIAAAVLRRLHLVVDEDDTALARAGGPGRSEGR